MLWFAVAIQVIVYYVRAGESVRCFECNDSPSPISCGDITTCSDIEACVIEQVITTSGHVIYNSGCEDKTRCQALSGRRSLTKRNSDIVTCRECCDGNFCNNKGCGNPDVSRPNRGVYCYNCPYLTDPQSCESVQICPPSQQCLTRIRKELIGVQGLPVEVYVSECEATSACTVLESHGFGTCCDTDFCNDHYTQPVTQAPTPAPITTTLPTVAPTEPPTVAPTVHQTQLVVTDIPEVVTTQSHGQHGQCSLSGGYTRLSLAHHRELCVKVVEGHLDWLHAKLACEGDHARLVVTNTAEKINALEDHLQHHSSHHNYWVGLWDQDNNNKFHWLTGELLTDEDWGTHPRQPTHVYGGRAEDCVYIYNRDHWHDTWCSHSEGYVCERV